MVLILSAGQCETPTGSCPDCNCPAIPDSIFYKDTSRIVLPTIVFSCNDTVIVKGYAFKDESGNLYTDNPLAMLMTQQSWVIGEMNKVTEAVTKMYNKDMNVTEHIIYQKVHDTVTITKYDTIKIIKHDTVYINTGGTTSNKLIADWKFNGNGNDETGKYPLTVAYPSWQYLISNPSPDGSIYLDCNNSGAYATAGIVPLGNTFSISLFFFQPNKTSDASPIIGNGKIYYPDGYILYIDEVARTIKFVTGDGTNRSILMTNDGVWNYNTWCNVVVTVHKISGVGKIYVNKVDQTKLTSNNIFKTFREDLPLLIGRSSDPSQMWGYLDGVKVWNYELTQAEIQAL